jgi:hypothetical protein
VQKSFFLMTENTNQVGLIQLSIWLVGEFGEMLINYEPTGQEEEFGEPATAD